jgi:hypothetical protein
MTESQQGTPVKLTDLQLVNAVHGLMLGKAQRLDRIALQLQITALVVNVAGLLLGMLYQTIVPLLAGLLVVVLGVCWMVQFRRYQVFRSVGERARRLHLMVDSMGIPLSIEDRSQLIRDADTVEEELRPYIQKEFFGAFGPAGTSRLIESEWESSFFSESLHKKAGNRYKVAFWSVLAVLVLAIGGVARFFQLSSALSAKDEVANILLTGGLVAIVSELYMRAERHDQAAREIDPLRIRLCNLYQMHKPDLSLVFLVIGSYNSTVENAPMIPNSVYVRNRDKLNKQFRDDKEAADKEKAKHRKP